MIETNFEKGVMLRWSIPGAKPLPPEDNWGDIIDNPQHRHILMTYLGVTATIFLKEAKLLHRPVQPCPNIELAAGTHIPHDWLMYAEGQTTRLISDDDILTGPMSGCIIAKWTENGHRYIGHVGTVLEKNPSRAVKSKFARSLPLGATGFNPKNAWSIGEISSIQKIMHPMTPPKIIALVTADNRFFSILMFSTDSPSTWVVGGCRPVAPMHYAQIMSKMLD